ncbi:MAG: aldose epimerase family protein [Flavobacteriaceae bacterium]
MKDLRDDDIIQLEFETIRVEISTLGACIRDLMVRSGDGTWISVVLKYPDSKDYIKDPLYLGSTVGRFANRIKRGKFQIGKNTQQVDVNWKEHHLHGGFDGLNIQNWELFEIQDNAENKSIHLRYHSESGEGGFVGDVIFDVVYTLNKEGILSIKYSGVASELTPINLTNHSYFNLNGSADIPVDNHLFEISSGQVLEVDQDLIPTGALLDYQELWPDMKADETMSLGNLIKERPFDTCFLMNRKNYFCSLMSPLTGIKMEVSSSLPAMQLYSPKFGGQSTYFKDTGFSAFCIEPGYCPDNLNHENFQKSLFDATHPYQGEISYSFSF